MTITMYKICRISFVALQFFVLTISSSAITDEYGPNTFSQKPFTAIVVAYEPEMRGLLEAIETDPNAQILDEYNFNGIKFKTGIYRKMPILVFATGMSIANAALSTQMALDYFPVNQLIYMGIAGAVNPRWKPGDVIVPERWYYHDESVYSNPKQSQSKSYVLPDYYSKFLEEQAIRQANDPHTPKYRPFHFIHPDEVLIIKEGMDKPEDQAYFSVTASLLEAARTAIGTMPAQMIFGKRKAQFSVGGNGVTGSVFVDNRDYRKWISDVFEAEVTEMESAAVGQVCTINAVDWIIIRSVSDLAGGQEGVNVEHIYDVEASRSGAALLFALLDQL